MIVYLVLLLSGFIALFILKSKRILFFNLAEQSVSLLNELLTDEEDDVKLELLQVSTNILVKTLLKNILLLVIAIVLAAIPFILYSMLSGLSFSPQEINLTSWQSLLAISMGATLPFFLPPKNKSTSNYSELSQLLHRLALNNYTIGYRLFKREVKADKKKGGRKNEKFLIVTGLARSGTTSLLNAIQQTGHFASLSYANMPFLMSPNSWKRIYNPKQVEQKERSHGDGIKISLDSTEALEEYFFKLKANDSFIQEERLKEYTLQTEDYDDYLDYQSIVVHQSEKTYLAKNNNFLLRYNSIRKRNTDFVTVVLCRHPLYHAASLLEKHLFYTNLQAEDPFVLEYMDWLGHHEFGLNQKVFEFENGRGVNSTDKTKLDYWLEVWINYYSKALTIEDKNTLLLTYEQFCKNPNSTIKRLLAKFSYQDSSENLNAHNNTRVVQYEYTQDLLEEALRIYKTTEQKASN
jgi:hypothetical protein